jgi:hypothetical protein
MVYNVTFNNISVISWRSVLLVEETGVPGENHRPALLPLSSVMVSPAQNLMSHAEITISFPVGNRDFLDKNQVFHTLTAVSVRKTFA